MNPLITTRRVFLAKGLTMLAAGATVPSFLNRTAFAVGDPFDLKRVNPDSGTDGKILVVVQLSGGNDGLNTVIPFAADDYYRARPTVAIARDACLKAGDALGFHPSLAPLKGLFDNGQVSILQGVGYPNPNRSHFRSMDIWHTANPAEEAIRSGWLGRYFDAQCCGNDPKRAPAHDPATCEAPADPQVGIALGETNVLAMQGERVLPLSFERPEDFRYKGIDRERFTALNTPSDAAADPATEAGQLEFLTRTAMDAQVSSDRVLAAVAQHNPQLGELSYPRGSFGDGLRSAAAMIRAGLPTRVYYVSLGGFDTHANQPGSHDRLMSTLATGVAAFMADLKQQGNDERVLVMTFSEFGRRVAQNASNGTDHGTAAPMFLFGHHNRVAAGFANPHPSLSDLDNGDLKYTVDFRNAYATVLQGWLGTDARTTAQILGGAFRPLPFLRG